jgi:hypothetical protein
MKKNSKTNTAIVNIVALNTFQSKNPCSERCNPNNRPSISPCLSERMNIYAGFFVLLRNKNNRILYPKKVVMDQIIILKLAIRAQTKTIFTSVGLVLVII